MIYHVKYRFLFIISKKKVIIIIKTLNILIYISVFKQREEKMKEPRIKIDFDLL